VVSGGYLIALVHWEGCLEDIWLYSSTGRGVWIFCVQNVGLLLCVFLSLERNTLLLFLSGTFVDFYVIQRPCVVLDCCFLLILHKKCKGMGNIEVLHLFSLL
jgi:hypothetical protein